MEEKNFYNSIFQSFLSKNNNKKSSRNSSFGSVFAERFNRSIRNILERPVFEKGDGNWIDVLPTIGKQIINRVHTSTKLKPTKASLKKNGGFVYQNLLDKRERVKPKFQVNDLVRTADLKKTISKSDLANWFYELYEITENFNDPKPSYRINHLPERYNGALLKKTELTMKETDSFLKKLNSN